MKSGMRTMDHSGGRVGKGIYLAFESESARRLDPMMLAARQELLQHSAGCVDRLQVGGLRPAGQADANWYLHVLRTEIRHQMSIQKAVHFAEQVLCSCARAPLATRRGSPLATLLSSNRLQACDSVLASRSAPPSPPPHPRQDVNI